MQLGGREDGCGRGKGIWEAGRFKMDYGDKCVMGREHGCGWGKGK